LPEDIATTLFLLLPTEVHSFIHVVRRAPDLGGIEFFCYMFYFHDTMWHTDIDKTLFYSFTMLLTQGNLDINFWNLTHFLKLNGDVN